MRLKRVKKVEDEVPEEVQRECSLLKDIDHPFIMTQVNTFETKKSVGSSDVFFKLS